MKDNLYEDNLFELSKLLAKKLDVPRAGRIELNDELEEQIRTVYDSLPVHFRERLHVLKMDTIKNHRTSFRLHFSYDEPKDGDHKKVLAYHLGQYLKRGKDYLFEDAIKERIEQQSKTSLDLELELNTR